MTARKFLKVGLYVIVSLLIFTGYASCKKISLSWWSPNWAAKQAEEMARKFERENPNITVDIEETVWEGMSTRILIALEGGSPPDVINAMVAWVLSYASRDLLMDLTERLDPAETEDFLDAAWKTNVYKGRVYGLPYRSEADALYYNKEAFRAAGLDPTKPPETFEELVEFTKKLTIDKDKDGLIDQYGYMIVAGEPGNCLWDFLPFVWGFGGDILNPEHTRAAIAEESALQGAKFYGDLILKYKVVPPGITTYITDDILRFFSTGKAIMTTDGPYTVDPLKEMVPDLEFGTALTPRGPAGSRDAPLGGFNVVIPKDAKHPEEAWKFVQFFVQPENMAAYTPTFPGRKSAMKYPRFQDPLMEPFMQQLRHSRSVPSYLPSWLEIQDVLYQELQSFVIRRKSVPEAMKDAAEQINEILAR